MAESKHRQIVAALVARLQAIVSDGGATYWYKPDRVVNVQSYERLDQDLSVGMVYAVRAGQEQHTEESTGSETGGGTMTAEAEFFVLMLRPSAGADTNPFGDDAATKALEQDRMARDFIRALLLDVTLGGLANNVVQGSLVIDRDTDVERLAVAEARFVVAYSYPARTP